MITPIPLRPALVGVPTPSLAALIPRLDDVGIIEHARGARPDRSSGHCSDDAGRALGLACLLASDPDAPRVATACLEQLRRSITPTGLVLRLDGLGRPTGDPPSADATARGLWGLALASTSGPSSSVRRTARALLARLDGFVSAWPRASAHAALAATVLLDADPASRSGARLLASTRPHLLHPRSNRDWPWPEARLTYGNALIPEALLAVGTVTDDESLVAEGLELLAWLVAHETRDGDHCSFTPASGRGPGERHRFDQQPIEAWALADASRRAFGITGDAAWIEPTRLAAQWFCGANDHGLVMWDRTTGAAYDGLTADGVNTNQGTESTLALIGASLAFYAVVDRLAVVPARPRRSRR